MAEELNLEHFDLGTFVDYVYALKQERDALRAQQSSQEGEAVEWQYQAPDGSWWGIAKSRLEEARLAGRPIRPLYTHPPTTPPDSRVVPVVLLERAAKHLSEGRVDGPAAHELRALLEVK